MILFQCPKCQASLKAPPDKIGARSKCNRCATPVVVPDPDAAPPVPTLVETPQPVSRGIPAEPEEDYEEDEEEPQQSPFLRACMGIFWVIDAVLDLRFKRYLTPYILKAAWILLIACCVGWFLLSRFAMPVIEAMGERLVPASLRQQVEAPPEPTFDRRSFRRSEPKPNPVADWIAGTILYVLFSVWLLMSTRVGMELIIVIFNISTDLEAVKRHLNSGP